MTIPTHLLHDLEWCDWCHNGFPAELVVGMEQTPERLCPGCYFCWKHGAPVLEREVHA